MAAIESGVPSEVRSGREKGVVARMLRVLRRRGAAERVRLEAEVRERRAAEVMLAAAAEKGRNAERRARESAGREWVEMLARMRRFVGEERFLGEER